MTMQTEVRAPRPYGNVTYADPKNGKYPIDTEAHIRAAWAYVNMPKNAAAYPLNGVTLESVKSRIRAAMKRIGADVEAGSHSAPRGPEWEQRRKRWANSLVGHTERRGMQIEMRSRPDGTGGTNFEFEGYASLFNVPFPMWDKYGDPYTEVVEHGAFSRSLARPGLDVPFLIGHDDKRPALARTRNGSMQLAQDQRGLYVRATLDGRRSDVRDLAYAVERGDTDEMSVGFVTLGQKWSDDYEIRSMLDLDIHRGDVSAVPLAAIPETAGAMITFPAETLSRRAAEARAGMNAAAAVLPGRFDPDHDGDDDSTPWGDTDNDFWNADGTQHKPLTTQPGHTHMHDDGQGGLHHHIHSHATDNVHAHDHPHSPELAQVTAAARPLAYRANPVDQDLGDAPAYDAQGQDRQQKCTNCQTVNDADARFCDQCGAGGDALVRIDDQGVPGMEEEQNASAMLAQRRRQLEFLRLSHRTEEVA